MLASSRDRRNHGMPALTRPKKITFGETRASGIRDLRVYCADYRCSHSMTVSGDRWPDDVRLSPATTSPSFRKPSTPRQFGNRRARETHSVFAVNKWATTMRFSNVCRKIARS